MKSRKETENDERKVTTGKSKWTTRTLSRSECAIVICRCRIYLPLIQTTTCLALIACVKIFVFVFLGAAEKGMRTYILNSQSHVDSPWTKWMEIQSNFAIEDFTTSQIDSNSRITNYIKMNFWLEIALKFDSLINFPSFRCYLFTQYKRRATHRNVVVSWFWHFIVQSNQATIETSVWWLDMTNTKSLQTELKR